MAEVTGHGVVSVRHELLVEFCTQVLQTLEMSPEDADIAANNLVTANLRGVDTHGVMRMPIYTAKLRGGYVNPRAELQPVRETVVTAVVDGQNGLGQVVAYRAMETAISKAKGRGISYVAVRNSSHFGTCAYYSMMALPHDMIGIALTNASPCIAPTGGAERLFGNNPWSIAVPAGDRLPVVLDMANSVVAMGKIRIAAKEGKPIPRDWALNAAGEPTSNPQEALRGFLLPVGGYKGYGITLMVDLLTGVLASSAFGPRVRGTDYLTEVAGAGHAFMALDISAFDEVADFKQRMDGYVDEIKAVRKAEGVETVYLPGELEFLKERERRENGIPLTPKAIEELRTISREYGVPVDL